MTCEQPTVKIHCAWCGSDFLCGEAPHDALGALCPQCGRGERTSKFRRRMDLACNPAAAGAFRSRSRIAGVITEEWCGRALYCAACTSDRIAPTRANTKVLDFTCPHCDSTYEVKSMSTRPGY